MENYVVRVMPGPMFSNTWQVEIKPAPECSSFVWEVWADGYTSEWRARQQSRELTNPPRLTQDGIDHSAIECCDPFVPGCV